VGANDRFGEKAGMLPVAQSSYSTHYSHVNKLFEFESFEQTSSAKVFSIPLPTFWKEKLWLNEYKEKNFIYRQRDVALFGVDRVC
jgi:hypothetical protein